MPLLAQVYCPLPASMCERVVYTFGCPFIACRGHKGAIRAWRVNIPWEKEVEPEPMEVEEPAPEVEQVGFKLGNLIFGEVPSGGIARAAVNFNPFAPSSTSSNPFLASSNPFAPAAPPPPTVVAKPTPRPRTPPPPAYAWPSPPSYPPQYLTTAYEPAPPPMSAALRLATAAANASSSASEAHREGKGAGGRVNKATVSNKGSGSSGGAEAGWGKEGYEVQKVKGVDEVFLRFQERVHREGLQVIRYVRLPSSLASTLTMGRFSYDFGSIPLAYSSSSPSYQLLFPSASYNPSVIPRCPTCSSPRTFELQLMPALVGTLNRNSTVAGSTALVFGEAVSAEEGVMKEDALDWATAGVFVCRNECTVEGEAWREEVVLIEWEEQ
jgi:pre-rRNA-processing protein TSR4